MSTYHVRLSWPMLIATIDIAQNYIGADSPRFRAQTLRALESRGIISTRRTAVAAVGGPEGARKAGKRLTALRLTSLGKKYCEVALHEYRTSYDEEEAAA